MLDALIPALDRPGAQRWMTAADAVAVMRGHGRRRRSRCHGHDPDARDEGPRVLPRRAEHRPPGSGRDVVGPAPCAPWPTPSPRAPTRRATGVDDRPERVASVGRAGSPGDRRRPASWSSAGRSPGPGGAAGRRACRRGDPADERARLAGGPRRRPPTNSRRSPRQTAGAGGRGGRRDLRGAGPVRADPGIVDPALAVVDGGATAAEAILRRPRTPGGHARRRRRRLLPRAGGRCPRRRPAGDDRLLGRDRPDLWHGDGSRRSSSSRRPRPVRRRDPATGARRRDRPRRRRTDRPRGDRRAGARDPARPRPRGSDVAQRRRTGGRSPSTGPSGRLLVDPSSRSVAATLRSSGSRAEPVGATPPSTAQSAGHDRGERRVRRWRPRRPSAPARTGVGLVRTELLFLGRPTPPTVAEQRSTLRAGSARRWAGARSCSGRSMSAATSRPSGSPDRRGEPGARRPRRPAGARATGPPGRPAPGAGRGGRRRASCGSCCRWSSTVEEVVAARSRPLVAAVAATRAASAPSRASASG